MILAPPPPSEKEIHFALKFSVSVTINCEDGKYYTGEIFKGSGIMRVKTGCQLSSSFFSFKGYANQTDTLKIIYDKRNHSCTEKKIVLRNQCGFYDVHIYIKILVPAALCRRFRRNSRRPLFLVLIFLLLHIHCAAKVHTLRSKGTYTARNVPLLKTL